MDENSKKLIEEMAKDKIQIILSGIAEAILVIMEIYVMINFSSKFLAMGIIVLLMIVALFFLINAIMDLNNKSRDMDQKKFDDIYNAQKASYLVIRKSFDELEERLNNIENATSLPAEEIINAQKAVAKVTISRSKENTDALMNSNDELINQLVNIQEKIENNNDSLLSKQQQQLEKTRTELERKLAELQSQISKMEGRLEGGMSVPQVQTIMPQPIIQQAPVVQPQPIAEPQAEAPNIEVENDLEAADLDIEQAFDETENELPADDIGLDIDLPVEEEPIEEPTEEAEGSDDLGLDLDLPVEEEPIEEPVEETEEAQNESDDLGLDLDLPVEEEPIPEDDLGLDLDLPVEEEPAEANEEIVLEEPVEEAAPVEEVAIEEPVAEETPAEDPVLEEALAAAEELDQIASGDKEVTEEDVPPEEDAETAEAAAPVEIPDVGIDLSDPNRVMSPEEIEKLFASI